MSYKARFSSLISTHNVFYQNQITLQRGGRILKRASQGKLKIPARFTFPAVQNPAVLDPDRGDGGKPADTAAGALAHIGDVIAVFVDIAGIVKNHPIDPCAGNDGKDQFRIELKHHLAAGFINDAVFVRFGNIHPLVAETAQAIDAAQIEFFVVGKGFGIVVFFDPADLGIGVADEPFTKDGNVPHGLADGFVETDIATQAGVFVTDAMPGTFGGVEGSVPGVVGQTGIDAAGPVDPFQFHDIGRYEGFVSVVDLDITAIQTITHAGGGVIQDRVAERKAAALTFTVVVIFVVFLVLVVNAGRTADPRVKQVRLQKAQDERGGLCADRPGEIKGLSAAEKVALGDGAGKKDFLLGTIAGAEGKAAGRLFGNIQLEDHFIFGRAFERVHLDVFEVIQAVEIADAALEILAAEQALFVDPQFAADDFVAGVGVAADDDLFEIDLLAFLDGEGDIHHLLLRVLIDARR